MSAREDLVTHHWELYRDLHGVKPRWVNYDLMSEAELESAIEGLYAEWRAAEEWEAHSRAMDAEAAKVAHLYNSEPLPYEEYYS